MFYEVRPDFVQCDSKGHPGYTSFYTKYGISADLQGDGLKQWRVISKKYYALLYAHYSGMMDISAVNRNPEWAKVDKSGEISKEYTSMFGEYVDKLMIPQLKELAGNYQLDGIWADGECWGAHPDYSEKTQKLFKEKTGLEATKDTREFIDFCMNELYILQPDVNILQDFILANENCVKIVTYAPELDSDRTFLKTLVDSRAIKNK